jgi:multiple sugar transport system substrate-binding protein
MRTWSSRMSTRRVFAALLVVAGLAVTAVASASATSSSSSLKGTISVLFTNNYMFDTDAQATTWWNNVQKEFQKMYPGATLKQLGVGGTDIDEMNKAALLFRSPSTTPDVIQLPTTYTSQFASSGYLLPLDSYVKSSSSAPFWAGIPKNVQTMGDYKGSLYSVNNGNNDFGVFYNKVMFKEAGLPTNWTPKNWNDILVAARAIHKKLPKVGALWLAAGVAAGPTNILQGIANLILGTKEPTIFDAKTGSYVVGSGLSDALNFYKSVYSEGLGAPVSQLFAPNAVGNPPQLFAEHKLAIAIAGANWFPSAWVAKGAPTYFPTAATDMGIAPMPTENGQAPGVVSSLGGWGVAIAKTTKYPQLAWNLVKLMMNPANQLTTAVWSGFVPPDTSIGASKAFVNSAPFQAQFNNYAKYGVALPSDPNFPIYARAVNTATGSFVQNAASTSVSSALSGISSSIKQNCASCKVEK